MSDSNLHPVMQGVFAPHMAAAADPSCPFVQAEISREQVRLAAARKEAARYGGVHFGGMESQPAKPRTLAQIFAAAEDAKASANAFQESPRGRFLSALVELERSPNCAAVAERLRGLYARSLADGLQPVNARAVGAALTLVNGLPSEAAHDLIDALAELLMQTEARAA